MKRNGFLDGYKTYDPEREGYGSRQQWRSAFFKRMSPDEAAQILSSRDPWEVLGLKHGASLRDIKKAFRELISKWHPDRNSDSKATEMSQIIIAAYSYLTQ